MNRPTFFFLRSTANTFVNMLTVYGFTIETREADVENKRESEKIFLFTRVDISQKVLCKFFVARVASLWWWLMLNSLHSLILICVSMVFLSLRVHLISRGWRNDSQKFLIRRIDLILMLLWILYFVVENDAILY